MKIKMAGIDYRKAPVKVRELFSMTNSVMARTLKQIYEKEGVSGCVVITTCNRTELWISGSEEPEEEPDPFVLLCREKGLNPGDYTDYVTEKSGMEAVSYLFELSCGLCSQIFGDDQIITQVKCALASAREAQTVDTVLEVLFRTAVTGAKKVKSKVKFTNVDRSVSTAMIDLLKNEGIALAGKRCMVIGNGEIGRLAAAQLVKAGAMVEMTLRQYKTREAIIPAGCRVIDYHERYEHISVVDIIVSATLSPHHTITCERAEKYLDGSGKVLVDLAIPRDIEPAVGGIPTVKLYDMDSFGQMKQENDEIQIEEARKILKTYEDEYETWYRFREWVPVVKEISRLAGEDVANRMKKELKNHGIEKAKREELHQAIGKAASKVVAKLCYGLREEMSEEQMKAAFGGLMASAKELE